MTVKVEQVYDKTELIWSLYVHICCSVATVRAPDDFGEDGELYQSLTHTFQLTSECLKGCRLYTGDEEISLILELRELLLRPFLQKWHKRENREDIDLDFRNSVKELQSKVRVWCNKLQKALGCHDLLAITGRLAKEAR